MRRFGMLGKVALIGAVLGLVSTSARAGYLVSLEQTGGGNVINVAPGDQFDVDVRLTSDAADAADAFEIWLVFDYGLGETDTSPRGFDYYSYVFGRGSSSADVFVPGGQNDTGSPTLGAGMDGINPVTINKDLAGPNLANSPNFFAIDLNIGALSELGTLFDEGVLATLTLGIPGDGSFVDGEPATVRLAVEGIKGPARVDIPFTIGSGLDINVIPEPATLVLIGLGGLAVLRRRRSA